MQTPEMFFIPASRDHLGDYYGEPTMSVIGIAYTSAGFIVGADGRGSYYENGKAPTDEEQKVFVAHNENNIFSYSLTGLTADRTYSFVNNCRKWSETLQDK